MLNVLKHDHFAGCLIILSRQWLKDIIDKFLSYCIAFILLLSLFILLYSIIMKYYIFHNDGHDSL